MKLIKKQKAQASQHDKHCKPAEEGLTTENGRRYEADLQGFQVRPALEAEGIAELPPGHELIKELAGAVTAVAEAVPCYLEGRDHPIVVIGYG